MADLTLYGIRQLAKGLIETVRHKDGIVAKATIPTRTFGENAATLALDRLDYTAVGIGKSNRGKEAGSSIIWVSCCNLGEDQGHLCNKSRIAAVTG